VTESRRLKRFAVCLFLILFGIGFVVDAWLGFSNLRSPWVLPLSLRPVELLFMWLFGPDVGAFVGSYLALVLGALLLVVGFAGLRYRSAS
jgi:hypothetical protein